MATFSISISIEIEADSYEEAYELERSITRTLEADPEILSVSSIDVEQTDGFDEEGDDDTELCPTCGAEWSGTSCGADDCGFVNGDDE